MIEKMRPYSSMILEPVGKKLSFINPDYISIAAFIAAILAGFYFYNGLLILGIIFTLLNGFLDVLDGKVARARPKINGTGLFIDHTLDRLCDMAIIIGISLSPYCPPYLGVILIFLTFIISYLGTLGIVLDVGKISGGLVSRADRVSMFVISAILQLNFDKLYGRYIFEWCIIVMCILSLITIFQRFFQILRGIDDN